MSDSNGNDTCEEMENDIPKPTPKTKFIGIYIPEEDWVKTGDVSCVVTSFKHVHEILKRNPHGRFMPADTEEEALFLATADGERGVVAVAEADDIPSPEKEVEVAQAKPKGRRGRYSLSALDDIAAKKQLESIDKEPNKKTTEVKRLVGEERDTRFPSPKVQELTLMARDITNNKTEAVMAKVKLNPRMLITESDIPTTVQEGCRYNALHVAAKCDNKVAVQFILDTVSSLQFMKLVYPKDDPPVIKARIKQIVNAYLNTPDKMTNETPLHFASKFLSVGAAEVLTSHPLCVLDAKNLFGETPASIIGKRADTKDKNFKDKCEKIEKLLSQLYIVPIWRDPMGIMHPVVGEVATIRQLGDSVPSHRLKYFPNMELQTLGPCDRSVYPPEKYLPGPGAVFESDVLWAIKAYGGPTDLVSAKKLHADLRLTCGRGYLTSGEPTAAPVLKDSQKRPVLTNNHRRSHRLSLGTMDGENQSPQSTPPRRSNGSSPPLSPFECSPLVNHLKTLGSPVSPGQNEIFTRRMDSEKGLEHIARKCAVQLGVKWNEEWKFLEFFGDLLSLEGLDLLETYLVKIESNRKEVGKLRSVPSNDRVHTTNSQESNNGMGNMALNDTGYPTPKKISECNNRECITSGRFCNCKNVAPALYFQQQETISIDTPPSPSTSSSSIGDEGSGSFDVDDSGESFYRKPATSPLTFDIKHVDEHPRPIVQSFLSSDSGGESSQANSRLADLSQEEDPIISPAEDEVFLSAESSPPESLVFFDCMDQPIFLNGSEPCKQDFQLYNLMKEDEGLFCDTNHVLALQWFNSVKALGNRNYRMEKRNTPISDIRSKNNIRARELPSYFSTPKKLNMS